MSASSRKGTGRFPISWPAFWQRLVDSPIETDLTDYQRLVAQLDRQPLRLASDSTLRARAAALARLWSSTLQPAISPNPPVADPASVEDLLSELGTNHPPRPLPPTVNGLNDELLVEAFSLVAEAARRTLGLDPFDVQLIAGFAMARGRIAELPTGEGKTLAAVFPAVCHSLSGRGVHVLTFNDYLARRDAAWMGPVFRLLGLSVGLIQEGQPLAEKRAAYAAAVTYATAKESGFDFLRDSQVRSPELLVHRPFHAALIDEADSILIDEARIPLVIADLETINRGEPEQLAAVVSGLISGRDFCASLDQRNVILTETGLARLEDRLDRGNLYDESNQDLIQAIHCALHAHVLLRRDVDYIVRDGQIGVIDEFTGRVVENRHWPDGLQAAVEAKEGVNRRSRGRVLGSIALQYYFRLYPILCGMTATARPAAAELKEFYQLGVTIIPPHAPSRRIDHPDAVFTHTAAKRRALVDEIARHTACRRPVLVGTASVRESEGLARDLIHAGITCRVLNAKNDEAEARIIAEAGRLGAVTISTNMAGRGTDIKLGGPDERERGEVLARGGLMVIGTNRHESLRIDLQLRGRAGRQGDPGESRFFVSLEDELFLRTGLGTQFSSRYRLSPSDQPVDIPRLHRDIVHAQRVFEGTNTAIRRALRSFASLIEMQRRIIQRWRDQLLHDPGGAELLEVCERALVEQGAVRLGAIRFQELQRRVALQHLDQAWSDHLSWVQETKESIHLVKLGGLKPVIEFQKQATAEFLAWAGDLGTVIAGELHTIIAEQRPVEVELERLKGPASTWTYLVDEHRYGLGLEALCGTSFGASAAMAFFGGPLFILTLLADRSAQRKQRRGQETPKTSG